MAPGRRIQASDPKQCATPWPSEGSRRRCGLESSSGAKMVAGRQFLARSMHASQNGNGGPFVVLDCAAHAGDALDLLLFGSRAAIEWIRMPDNQQPATRGDQRNPLLAARSRTSSSACRPASHECYATARPGSQGSGRRVSLDVRPVAGVEPGFQRLPGDCRVMRRPGSHGLPMIGIEIPPLRQRREDIPAIARELLRDICAINHLPSKTLSRPALALLAALPWHGNVSELRAAARGYRQRICARPHHRARRRRGAAALNGSSPVPRRSDSEEGARADSSASTSPPRSNITTAASVTPRMRLGLRRTNLYQEDPVVADRSEAPSTVSIRSITSMHVLHVVGARPNLMKAAPVHRALAERGVAPGHRAHRSALRPGHVGRHSQGTRTCRRRT